MVITYHGAAFVKIVFGETTIAVNPIGKSSKEKGARFGADIALVSLRHEDFNGIDQVAHGDREPFVIDGPGEYEVKKVFIRGFPSVSLYGGEERINTMYLVTLEGMNLCFLGALSSRKLPAAFQEAVENVDVLFVPIGGAGTLKAAEAHELSVELEAGIVIPLLYNVEGAQKGSLQKFLGEENAKNEKFLEKLTLKKKDVEEKTGEIVVLKE